MTREEILTTAATICMSPEDLRTECEQEYLSWMREECTKKLIEILRTGKTLVRISFWSIGKAPDYPVAPDKTIHNTDIKLYFTDPKVYDIKDITDSKAPILEGLNLVKLSVTISTAGESVLSLVNRLRYNNILFQGKRVFVGFGEDEPVFKQPEITHNALTANGIML